jgi:ComF family protein
LFFPRICLACDKNLQARGHLFCIHCSYTLAITDQWKKPENEFTEKFAGRLKLEQGAALYRFVPGGQLQQVIHKLKYQNRPDVGIHLGRTAGHQIQRYWKLPDLIVPVPLHPKKYWQRGYNQAEKIARGIGEITGIPVLPNALEKAGYTQSQTRLHRLERMQNMEKSFVQKPSAEMIGKHVLLVDDVLTTGATLEACALEILRNPGSRISMCTLAMGRRI